MSPLSSPYPVHPPSSRSTCHPGGRPAHHFAVMALVESQQVLTSPHECGLCDDVISTSYCLHCNVKLCAHCAKGHKKIPATKNHVIEDLNKVTVERLAETNRIMCKAHPDRLGELYCPAHKEVICILCLGTSHERCTGKKSIADAADEERAEFKDRACALRQSEATIAQQVRQCIVISTVMFMSCGMLVG